MYSDIYRFISNLFFTTQTVMILCRHKVVNVRTLSCFVIGNKISTVDYHIRHVQNNNYEGAAFDTEEEAQQCEANLFHKIIFEEFISNGWKEASYI